MPMTMSSARTLPDSKSNRPQISEEAFESFIDCAKSGRTPLRRRLAKFELFGDDSVARYTQRAELRSKVRNEARLAAQHHRIVFQRRDVRCDLSSGDSS